MTITDSENRRAGPDSSPHAPAEAGTWVFILGDLTIFALMFGAFIWSRADHEVDFLAGHHAMSRTSGALMTLTLLVSSLAVVLAVERIRAGVMRSARRLLFLAIACGSLFGVLKAVEYHDKFSHGHDLVASQFWAFYFGLTGIHLAHVLIGMIALGVVASSTRGRSRLAPRRLRLVEGVAVFWHMVDAVWIVLFALFYLVR